MKADNMETNTISESDDSEANSSNNTTTYYLYKNIQEDKNKINTFFIDVRSSKEFKEDHVPGSINIPILDNNERAIIGLLYKNKGQETAINEGIKLFQAKFGSLYSKLSIILNQIRSQSKNSKTNVCIYCWRGGMRSNSMSFLIKSFLALHKKTEDDKSNNISIFCIKNGYKGYRNSVLSQLKTFKLKGKFIVLHGLTGVGKTDLLLKLQKMKQPVLDLEGLAKHRSSLYGRVGLKPVKQKMFDSLLLDKLQTLKNEKYIFIEGESRKVGSVAIEDNIFKQMLKGINVKITADLMIREKRLVDEYTKHTTDINSEANKKDLIKITESIKKLSNKQKADIIEAIENNNLEKASEHLLNYYYDPLYNYSLDKISYDISINSNDYAIAIKELIHFKNSLR